jgi:hypothetical protein
MAHGNLSVDAIFVNPNESCMIIFITFSNSADWKVGGLEFTYALDNEKDFAALQESYSYQKTKAIPPEYVIDENNVRCCVIKE